jgi:hypothetical protein
MEQAVVIAIDGSLQSVPITLELNHDFIDCNLIRVSTVCRL